jgi:hypothetical protein
MLYEQVAKSSAPKLANLPAPLTVVFAVGSNGHAYALRYAGYGASVFVSVLTFCLGLVARDDARPVAGRVSFLLQIPVSFVVGFLYGAFLYTLVQVPVKFSSSITITSSGPIWWALLVMLTSSLVAFMLLDSRSSLHRAVLLESG